MNAQTLANWNALRQAHGSKPLSMEQAAAELEKLEPEVRDAILSAIKEKKRKGERRGGIRGGVRLGEIAVDGDYAKYSALLQPAYERERWEWLRRGAMVIPTVDFVEETLRSIAHSATESGGCMSGGLAVEKINGSLVLFVDPRLATAAPTPEARP